MNEFRTEYDLLGPVKVPADAFYGAQTQRAVQNFPTRNHGTLGDFPHMVESLMKVKSAAASVNARISAITAERGRAIQEAVEAVFNKKLFGEFPVHYLHGGGGTSANMNANEVLANLGEEILGGVRGNYKLLHPNDHVNLNQSTNDVYPTACHLAVIEKWKELRRAFQILDEALTQKISEVETQRRLARTCLQDAVDISFSDFLGGYTGFISRSRERLEREVSELAKVNIGGTIVGRKDDVPEEYFDTVVESLNDLISDYEITRSKNLFDAAQNLDDLVSVSGQLELAARSLVKIGKDFRLLSSGPERGFAEIILPALQPGSSVMPGKVNPVMPEFLIQVCFRVIGNHQMCASALEHGELDLNVWESPVVFGILDSMDLLEIALQNFAEKCVSGMVFPETPNTERAESLTAKLTELSRKHGYSRISDICKEAGPDLERIRQILKDRGLDD